MAEETFEELMEGLSAGEDEAAEIVFTRFVRRLVGLAGTRLNSMIKQKQDPEDVVQSVFRTFFRRSSDGQFKFEDWDGLWAMLALMTLRKCGNRVEYFYAARRDVHRDVQANPNHSKAALTAWQGIAREPTPAEAAVMADTLEAVMAGMNEQEQIILSRRLQGNSIAEISSEVGRSERSVSRLLERARKRLRRLEEDD